MPKRVFVSFDFDNDLNLKNLLIGQARNKRTDFELADWSLKETQPTATWERNARARIKRSGIVLVLVGRSTHRASGVLKEVKIAREEKIPIVQVTKEGSGYTRVADAGGVPDVAENGGRRQLTVPNLRSCAQPPCGSARSEWLRTFARCRQVDAYN